MRALLLETDRIVSKCIVEELLKRNIKTTVAVNGEDAIIAADEFAPDIVICELSLYSHSGSEFLYEFRTYSDWQTIPIVIYSSIEVPKSILESKDWKLLNLSKTLYKPDDSLQKLGNEIESLLAT